MDSPIFDTTFQTILGKAVLIAAILYILSVVLLGFSSMYTNQSSCPTFTGITYYTVPVG